MAHAQIEMMFGTFLTIKNELKNAQLQFNKLVVDKTIPLEDRWNLFCKAPDELTEVYEWMWDPVCLMMEMCDIIGGDYERHRKVDLIDFDEIYLEDEPIEVINEFKEEVLKSGYRAFTVDW